VIRHCRQIEIAACLLRIEKQLRIDLQKLNEKLNRIETKVLLIRLFRNLSCSHRYREKF